MKQVRPGMIGVGNIGTGHAENIPAGRILRGEGLTADGREGVRGLTLSNAMYLSSRLGKPVSIPFDEQLFREMLMERCRTFRHKEESDITFDPKGS